MIKEDTTLEFKSGAAILRILEDCQVDVPKMKAEKKKLWKDTNANIGRNWKITINQFLAKITDETLRTKLTAMYNSLQKLNGNDTR